MNIEKIRQLTDTLNGLNTARFDTPNWATVSFRTGTLFCTKQAIFTSGFGMEDKRHYDLCKELNDAIKPVIEKYIKITEQEIKDTTNA